MPIAFHIEERKRNKASVINTYASTYSRDIASLKAEESLSSELCYHIMGSGCTTTRLTRVVGEKQGINFKLCAQTNADVKTMVADILNGQCKAEDIVHSRRYWRTTEGLWVVEFQQANSLVNSMCPYWMTCNLYR